MNKLRAQKLIWFLEYSGVHVGVMFAYYIMGLKGLF